MTLTELDIFLRSHLADREDGIPKGYRLTLVARHVSRPDAELVLTGDDLVPAAAALAKHVPRDVGETIV